MKAVVMTRPGGPEVLEVRELPDPEPRAPTEMLVRVHAAGVNPVDTKLRARGTYYPERMPAILGCDGAGVVERVGPEVRRFRPGDAVWWCNGGIGGEPGAYAELAVVDERFAAPVPEGVDLIHAAAAPLVLITAWESLHDRARVAAGQKVLVHAGAGGVGHVAVQLAREAGCAVAATVSTEEKARFVGDLGAERAIRYRDEDFVEAARDWAEDGADVVLDTVGGETFQRSFAATRHYGDLVTLLQPPAGTDWKEARLRNLRVSLELMLTPMLRGLTAARRHHAEILERCGELMATGRLRVHVADTFPLERAAEAHRRIEAGGMTGKLVLVVRP